MANKEKSGFMKWYESYKGKRVTGIIYSVGAAVVIIGALFKILHWPGASAVLMIGMFTEAFLFMIGTLDAPHPTYAWEQVFPQLISLEHGAEPGLFEEISKREKPTLLGSMGGGSNGGNGGGAGLPAGSLSDKDQASLSEGIQKLAKTAAQLNDLSNVAASTAKLGEKMEVAGVAMEKFAASAANMSGQAETYEKGLTAVNANLNNLNAVYELQLKSAQAQAEKTSEAASQIENMAKDLKKAADATSAAAKSSETFQTAAQSLAGYVTSLNEIYGNMLSAVK